LPFSQDFRRPGVLRRCPGGVLFQAQRRLAPRGVVDHGQDALSGFALLFREFEGGVADFLEGGGVRVHGISPFMIATVAPFTRS
jgi:hypothetical protein